MKSHVRPRMVLPEGASIEPETGAVVYPEGADPPTAEVPHYVNEIHDGRPEDCTRCQPDR